MKSGKYGRDQEQKGEENVCMLEDGKNGKGTWNRKKKEERRDER